MLSLVSGGFCTTVHNERAVISNSHRKRYFISWSRKYIINTLLLIITGFLATNILRLLLHRHSPWCILPPSTIFLHYRWSPKTACHLSYSITFKFSSTLSLHLLRDFPLSLLSLWLLQFVSAFDGYAFFQHDHIITVGGILYIAQYLPLLYLPVC
jgi:hypothetical protein